MPNHENSGKNKQRERKKERERHLHIEDAVPKLRLVPPLVDRQAAPEHEEGAADEIRTESSIHFSPRMKTTVRIFLMCIGVSIVLSVLAYTLL